MRAPPRTTPAPLLLALWAVTGGCPRRSAPPPPPPPRHRDAIPARDATVLQAPMNQNVQWNDNVVVISGEDVLALRDVGTLTRSFDVTIPIPAGEDARCATDADCPRGTCFTAELEAQFSRAFRDCENGRAWRALHRLNTCIRPACATDADCPAGHRCADSHMVPFPQRVCLPAGCAQFQCNRFANGTCATYVVGTHCEHGGWNCSYPADTCAPHDITRRCPPRDGMIGYCVPREGRFRCVYEPPPPP